MKYRFYTIDRTNFIEVEAESQDSAIRQVNQQIELNRTFIPPASIKELHLKKYEIRYEYIKYHKAIRYATSEEEAKKLFLEDHSWSDDEYDESEDKITSIAEIKEN